MDGGILNDYPVDECIRHQKCNIGEILGVKMLWERKPANLSDKSSLLQFVNTFFNQINANFFENRVKRAIPNEVVCVSKVFTSQDWINWMKDENYRRELVLRGETFANVFLSYRRNYNESQRETEQEVTTPADSKSSPRNLIQLPVSIPEDENDDEDEEKPKKEEEDDEILSSTNDTELETRHPSTFEVHNTDDVTMV
jgi:hypothetical protein